jgi:hypothetical protein
MTNYQELYTEVSVTLWIPLVQLSFETKNFSTWYIFSEIQEQVITVYAEKYEGVSRSFRTGRLQRELQIVQLSATTCTCIATSWVSPVSFVTINLYIASQRVFIVVIVVYIAMTQSGNVWIHPRICSAISFAAMVWIRLASPIMNLKTNDVRRTARDRVRKICVILVY